MRRSVPVPQPKPAWLTDPQVRAWVASQQKLTKDMPADAPMPTMRGQSRSGTVASKSDKTDIHDKTPGCNRTHTAKRMGSKRSYSVLITP